MDAPLGLHREIAAMLGILLLSLILLICVYAMGRMVLFPIEQFVRSGFEAIEGLLEACLRPLMALVVALVAAQFILWSVKWYIRCWAYHTSLAALSTYHWLFLFLLIEVLGWALLNLDPQNLALAHR